MISKRRNFECFIAACAIALLAVSISLSYHLQLLTRGFLYFDSIGYIGSFLGNSRYMGEFGVWAALGRILSGPNSMVMAVSVITHKSGVITTTPHLPQVAVFMAVYCYLVIKIAKNRGSEVLGILLSLSIVPTFLVFGVKHSIADFWLESASIWLYGILLIFMVEARWFTRPVYTILSGVVLSILMLYRLTYPIMSISGFLIYGLISMGIVIYKLNQSVERKALLSRQIKSYFGFLVPVIISIAIIMLFQYENILAKMARGYARVENTEEVIRFVQSAFERFIIKREPIWVISLLTLLLVLVLSIFRKIHKDDLNAIGALILLSMGFWFTSIFILGARYHSYNTAFIIQAHLLLVYSILALKDSRITFAAFENKILVFVLLTYLSVSVVYVKNYADTQTEVLVNRTGEIRNLMSRFTSTIDSFTPVEQVGLWYNEHFVHLSMFNKIFQGKPVSFKKTGRFSVHGSYYRAAQPGWKPQQWVEYNLNSASQKRTIVFTFCSENDVRKSKIYFSNPGMSRTIANELQRTLFASDQWKMFKDFKYMGTNAKLCAFRNFELGTSH